MNDIRIKELEDKKEGVSDDGIPEKRKAGESKNKRQKWKRILTIVSITIILILISIISVLFYLKSKGAKNLKAEEQYITYGEKRYKYREEIVNILCLGIDKYIPLQYMPDDRDNIGMADAIFLISIDTKKDTVKVFVIPRDTMVDVQLISAGAMPGEKEERQICYQYAYGKTVEQSNELTVDAVSRLLYNTQIQRYCTINMEAIPILNDAIGGVDVVVQEHLEEFVPTLGFVYGEKVHLEGKKAFQYINVRNTKQVDGSLLRIQRQKQYALAFVEKAKTVIAKDSSVAIEIFQKLQSEGYMSTNITMEDISYLLSELLRVSFSEEDMMQVLPGENKMGEDGFVEYHIDRDSVKKLVIDNFYEEV